MLSVKKSMTFFITEWGQVQVLTFLRNAPGPGVPVGKGEGAGSPFNY